MKQKFILLCLLLSVSAFNLNAQNFFSNLWSSITSTVQPVWGEYSEGGMPQNGYHPLTTFDKKNDIYDEVEKIRNLIKSDEHYYKQIYQRIYNNVINCNGATEIECIPHSRAKDAAFVYLIGLDGNGNDFTGTSNPTREYFKQYYINVMNGWTDDHDYSGKENQLYRARENIVLMQGYDYLVLAEWTGGIKLTDNENDKLREEIFQFTYQLYSRANNIFGAFGTWPINPKNNMPLVVSAAVGMGAIILHNRGTYWWATQRKPDRWANSANAYINDVMWEMGNPMGTRGKELGAGYAEGTHYYRVAFEALWPYFQSFKNFTRAEEKRFGPYYKCALCFTGEYVNNYYNDKDFLMLNDWYVNLMQPNGDAPALDDSWIAKTFAGTALDGIPEHSVIENPSEELDENINIKADYLAKFNYGTTAPFINYTNKESGDLIARIQYGSSDKDKHYLHLNAERGTALNGGEPERAFIPAPLTTIFDVPSHISWGHEHGDVGSILICAGEDILAIDPPLFGDKNHDNFLINQGHQHNVITIDGEGPHAEDYSIYSDFKPSIGGYGTFYTKNLYWNRTFGIKTDLNATVEREIEIVEGTYGPKYVINDFVTNEEIFGAQVVSFNLNGNGNVNQNPPTFSQPANNAAIWNHPCFKDNHNEDNWQMRLTLTSSKIGSEPLSTVLYNSSTHSHGNTRKVYSTNTSIDNSWVDGKGLIADLDGKTGLHTRVYNNIGVLPSEKLHFKATIEVLPCFLEWGPLPLQKTSSVYTSHLTQDSIENGKIFYYHFSRHNNSPTADTSINPFNIDSTAILETDAQNVFFSYSTNPIVVRKGCTTALNFRKLRMANGREVTYHDTTFIESNKVATAFYSFIGKMKYDAYVETDTACSVKFLIPDGITGYQMTIKNDTISSTYNDATKILTATFSKPGFYRFVMELVDPCLMSCFFPPTADSIKNTFHFYEGTYEYLAHDLDIVADTGQLLLTHGSRMHICQNYTLVNNDSIVLKPYIGFNAGLGLPMVTPMAGTEGLTPNHLNYPGDAFANLPNEKRTSIIVDNKAALVLDSGSYTHIGVNCLLWIKKGGTLLVKKGAMLEVGSCGVGYDGISCGGANKGTVIIDDSAFICVEDSALLRFFKLIGDTVDRNIFFISTHPDKPAIAGINTLGASGKFNASDWNGNPGRFYNHNCIELCSLHVVNPPDVVHNEPWGWCNYNIPKSSFIVKSPYCVNDTVFLEQADKSLNETKSIIQIFQHDTLYPIRTGNAERFRLENYEKLNFFNFDSPDVYYIRVITVNSCGRSDTLTRSLVVIGNPTPSFTLSSHNICPGKGNVYSLFNAGPFTSYNWHVHAIDTSINPYVATITETPHYGGDWVMDSLISDTFKFDDFYFYGGLKYAVALTTRTPCATKTIWDTIEVQPGAFIQLSRPLVYASPINGATSVQLNGYMTEVDSFRWEPTTWLNRTDTNVVISTPEDSIYYVLIAKYGECTATDTAIIKYNRVANAGINDTICFTNDTAILGNSYDMSIFLGFLYYKGGSNFYDLYSTKTSTNPAYFRYLTHFLMHNDMVEQWLQCGTPIMDKFKDQIYRRQIMRQPWFKAYYTQLTEFTDPDMAAFDIFVDGINSNYELSSNMDAQGGWGEFEYCVTQLFDYYADFVTNHLNEISSTWVSVANEDTTVLTAWDEYFVAAVNPTVSTSYIQTVITPQYAEIDEVTIYRDTILAPFFYPAMQFDSTVYFANLTSPFSAASSYSWNFGDGSPLDYNPFPIHTFPAFDSSYIVCLSAFNKCGSFMYCDTIRIDSSSLSNQRVVYNNRPGLSNQADNALYSDKQVIGGISRPEIFLTNYPNPFGDKTIIDYQIWQTFSNASLIVTNTLGQVVYDQKLIKPIDKVSLDGNLFSNGLYYYSIVIDNSTKLTKMMSVMH